MAKASNRADGEFRPGEDRIFGANPFAREDPRHANWLVLARAIAEADERLKARALHRSQNSPDEDFVECVLEYVVGRFDIGATGLLATVHDYPSAAAYNELLMELSRRSMSWLQMTRSSHSRRSELLAIARIRLQQRSAHWFSEGLAKARANGEALQTRTQLEESSLSRTIRVDRFLDACNREDTEGVRIVKRHIWKAEKYEDRQQFQRWQRGDKKASDSDHRKFEGVLQTAPREFIARLKLQGHLKHRKRNARE